MQIYSKSRVTIFLVCIVVAAATFSQTSDGPRDRKARNIMLANLLNPEIKIKKKHRVLEVFDNGRMVKAFTVVLGFAPTGDKEIEGDGRTPEGEFYVFTKNAESKFHLSLGLSYPSKNDANRGFADGLITKAERDEIVAAVDNKRMPPQKTALGGEIYIHGGGTERDWTWGCVALKNDEIEELFAKVPVGTKVTILP
jgi:murein L,D-transpeptidase YafK